MVWFLYRDEVYTERVDNQGLAELIVAKQRNGPTGVVELRWQAPLMKFGEIDWRGAP